MVGSDTIYHSEKNLRDPLTRSLIGSFDEPSTFSGGFEQYVMAKFYLAWFVEKLATQVSADHVIVNMAMPGLCKGTAFIRPPHDTWYMKLALALMGKTATRGANAIVTAAVVLSKASHGGLINEGNIKP
ncbi:hypothetical protein LMH87_004920 [Akanthomyces muscarius]|uniref:Short-chain dehydrogenase/reductase n=1 Tax=Akanthomyces muscarius TaxID=2231603 RepID=A0A9W8QM80_AKAMU|nr:hypothetical protein LMH87_004920 [Akanthomyces muscarius]KAJ4163176.1 hypothetical protein LMH87_004920 [Akanthomyces muscarius]